MNTTIKTPNFTYAEPCTRALASTSFAKRATASWLHFLMLLVTGQVSSGNKSFTGFLPKATWRVALIFVTFLLMAGTSFAQVVLPDEDRCTSKDLELVSARLDVPACQSCTGNSLITAPLLLAIDNKTGSTRTSFAFWGDIVITNSAGVVTYQAEVTGCNGKIVRNDITELPYTVVQIREIINLPTSGSGLSSNGQITYECGSTLDLTNLFLAWTDASPKSTCGTLKSELIAPKCGTLPAIAISTGLSAGAIVTPISCFGEDDGAINLSVFGGVAPFTYDWADLTGPNEPQDRSNLGPGDYSVTVTDSKGCTATYSTTLTEPAEVLEPTATVVEPGLCGGPATGTVTVTAPLSSGTVQYQYNNNGGAWQTSPIFGNLAAGSSFSIRARIVGTTCESQPFDCEDYQNQLNGITAIQTAKAPAPLALKSSIQTEAYPNPTGRDATINFSVPKSGRVMVEVYNSIGARVATLFDGKVSANEQRSVVLKGSALPSGTYTYRVISNGKTKTSRISLVK
ncbi:T9SS type A sorting domain-containing protein [Hymenobacter sp. BT683]|uniref:T9SS type A sorting domain-containing protein n=1 Tax=Hymenobacter jeongseonensis TaxID=2791027 RepID=A0ABS0IE77_9BACT|nr:T9SS type A sorting domain-containing protein [Hymenobacter jeongseonensis]MBF9236656.1 T9SS type A sorting domain-containing protein [Hymenobacter jeongseonensis]